MPERVAWLDKVRRVLAESPLRNLQQNVALNILAQKALRVRGYNGAGVLDDKLLTALGMVFP